MPIEITVPLGVVVAREKIDRPWQEYRWRAVGIFLDAPKKADWREFTRKNAISQFHAATVPLVLQRRESMSYCVNLANGEPSIYVVLREENDPAAPRPVSVHAVTASPFEAQVHSDMAFATVDRLAMPKRLLTMVEAFVEEHNVVEQRHDNVHLQQRAEDDRRLFKQEPVFMLRDRQDMHAGTAIVPKSGRDDKA